MREDTRALDTLNQGHSDKKMGRDTPRVATVREKSLENEIFSRSGKSQGILISGKFRKNAKSQGKVREFQISLEMVWLWQSSEK